VYPGDRSLSIPQCGATIPSTNEVSMSESFIPRRLQLCACVIALATACVDAATGPAKSEPAVTTLAAQQASGVVDISGVWPFHEDAVFLLYDFTGQATKAFRCSTDGTYTFAQTGDTFTGSFDQVGSCTAADGTTFPNDFSGGTVTGTIQGLHVSFATGDGCTLDGSLRGSALNEMGGSSRCGGGGFFGSYRASWSATR
jgi:hypothetical protein